MSRILVVEDNDENYLLIEVILRKYDITLTRAATGKEFYSIISQSTNFDLVLMDLMLPDSDGIELTRHLFNNKITIPIVVISAYTERCEEIFDLGVEYFLNKPLMSELFLSVIRKFIEI
jgi:CheY-like chemotaxis protein